MIRGCLVAEMYIHSLSLRENVSGSVGSAILTLAGPDVTAISKALENLHEIWANSIEIALAMWLLARELGPGCVGPAISVIGKFESPLHIATDNEISRDDRDGTADQIHGPCHESLE